MGISVEDAVKELQARETVFVAYSQATKLPYVTGKNRKKTRSQSDGAG